MCDMQTLATTNARGRVAITTNCCTCTTIRTTILAYHLLKHKLNLASILDSSQNMSAVIIADSIGPNSSRITTFVLTYPRFIHAEFMSHRVFSRNSSSSRAIPVKKVIQMVKDDPVIPLSFTKNKAGMQGGEPLSGNQETSAIALWLKGRDQAIEIAQQLAELEVHKQYVNRILEPYSRITVVATATDFENWFSLRCHYMAQPEICQLATEMLKKYKASIPKVLESGMWHLPFITDEGPNQISIKRSVARCARVSYLNHNGITASEEDDIKLYERLVGSIPIHASPAEHQAQACNSMEMSGNFRGWLQYRKIIELRPDSVTID